MMELFNPIMGLITLILIILIPLRLNRIWEFIFSFLLLFSVDFSVVILSENVDAMVLLLMDFFSGLVIALPHVLVAILLGLVCGVVCYYITQWKARKQDQFGCQKDIDLPSSIFKTPSNCMKKNADWLRQSSVYPARSIDADQYERLRTFGPNYDWQFSALTLAEEGFTFYEDQVQCYRCGRQFTERNLPRSEDDRHDESCLCREQRLQNYQSLWGDRASRETASSELAQGATGMSSPTGASLALTQSATGISLPPDASLALTQSATGISLPPGASLALTHGVTGMALPTDAPDDDDVTLADVPSPIEIVLSEDQYGDVSITE